MEVISNSILFEIIKDAVIVIATALLVISSYEDGKGKAGYTILTIAGVILIVIILYGAIMYFSGYAG